jgi:hypothetical protein
MTAVSLKPPWSRAARARGDDVGAGLGLGNGAPGQGTQRRVVIDDAVRCDRAAVTVAGVLTKTRVGDEGQRQVTRAEVAQGRLDDAVVDPGATPLLVL